MSMLKGLSVGAVWGGILAAVVLLVLSLATPVPGSRLASDPAPSMPVATALPPSDVAEQDPAPEQPSSADLSAEPEADPAQSSAGTLEAGRAQNQAPDAVAVPGTAPQGTRTVTALGQPAPEQPLPALVPSLDPRPEAAPSAAYATPSLPPELPPGPVARAGTPALTELEATGLPEFAANQVERAPERPAALVPPVASSPEPPATQVLPVTPVATTTEPVPPQIAGMDAPMRAPATDAVPDLPPIEQAPTLALDSQTAAIPLAEIQPDAGSQNALPSLPEIAGLGPSPAAPAAADAPVLPSVADPAQARAPQAASRAPLADVAPRAARSEPQAPAFPAPTEPAQRIAALAEPDGPGGAVPVLRGGDAAPATAEAQGPGAVDISAAPRVASDIAAPPATGDEIVLAQAPPEQDAPAVAAPQDTAPQTAPPALLAIAPPSSGPRPETNAPDADQPAPAQVPTAAPQVRNPLEDRDGMPTGGLGLPQVSRFGVTSQPIASAEPPVADAVAEAPALLAHAAPFDLGETRPLLAIVLLVDPGGTVDADAIATLPMPVTVALAHEDAGQAGALRAAGLEIALRLGNSPVTMLEAALADLPETVALLDDAAGTLQSDRDALDQVLARIAQTGHGLLTYPRGFNTAERVAAQQGLAAKTLFRDLTGLPEAEMRRVLDRAGFAAGLEGAAVVAAPLQPDVLSVLITWALADRSDAVAIAPVSAVLQRR